MKKIFLSSALLLSSLFLSGTMLFVEQNIIEKQKVETFSESPEPVEGNTEFGIYSKSLSGNTVSFSVSYKQGDVWYWDQVKEDFIYWSWAQNEWDNFHYDSINNTPTLSIKHDKVFQEDEDGNIFPGDPPIPDETVGSWKRESYTTGSLTAKYKWDDVDSKANKPSFGSGWEISTMSNLDDNWIQYEFNNWDWIYEDTASLWKDATIRGETGLGNKRAWIEWELISEGNIEQKGSEEINFNYSNTPSSDIDQSGLELELEKEYTKYNIDDDNFNHQSSNRPSINIPEPKDSGNGSINGNEIITIDNLSSGWNYEVKVILKYEKPNGEIISDSYSSGEFNISRGPPSHIIIPSSESDNSVTFEVEIEDNQSARTTPVSWTLSNEEGTIVDQGSFNSNYYKETFTGLNSDEIYTFDISYDYSLNSSIPGTTNNYDSRSQKVNGPSEESFITINDFSVENISSTEFILTMDVDAKDNFIPEDTVAGWTINGDEYDIELHNGTNSLIVSADIVPKTIEVGVYIDGVEDSSTPPNKTYDLDTNLSAPFGVSITNQTSTNRESVINYEVYGDESQIQTLEYKINNEGWILIDPTETELTLTGLNPGTEYSVEMRTTGPPINDNSEGFTNYSNHFVFTTDKDTSMSLDASLTVQDPNSVSVAFVVDNYKYFDDRKVTWVVEDLNTNKYIQEGDVEVNSNGPIHFTIDNLNPGTNYRIFINAKIEGEIFEDHIDFNTSGDKYLDQRDNALITSVEKGKHNTFNIEYTGTAKYIEYSTTSKEGSWEKVPMTFDDNKEISITPDVNSDIFYFRLNGSSNSIFTWYEGDNNTSLYVPWVPNYLLITLVSILLIVLFIAVVSASVFGYYYWLKKSGKNKSRINMWGK